MVVCLSGGDVWLCGCQVVLCGCVCQVVMLWVVWLLGCVARRGAEGQENCVVRHIV